MGSGLGPTNILWPIITIQSHKFKTKSKEIVIIELRRPSAKLEPIWPSTNSKFHRLGVESKMGKSIFALRVVTKISWVFSKGF